MNKYYSLDWADCNTCHAYVMRMIDWQTSLDVKVLMCYTLHQTSLLSGAMESQHRVIRKVFQILSLIMLCIREKMAFLKKVWWDVLGGEELGIYYAKCFKINIILCYIPVCMNQIASITKVTIGRNSAGQGLRRETGVCSKINKCSV